tara:strand:+ start:1739 stop:2326 length:588 start_codon:yes stop_codon:yes gene_type:complete
MEQFDQSAVEAMSKAGRAIPGQSLTNSPDTPYPWEQPASFTDINEALDYLVSELIQEERYVSLISGIGQGVPVSDVTMQLLYKGFQEGLFNPDLMLMLIEPLMYIIIALAERAGVDYSVYVDDESDDEVELSEDEANKFEQVKNLTQINLPTKESISKLSVPDEVLERIEELPIEKSMLAKDEPTSEAETSLLGR